MPRSCAPSARARAASRAPSSPPERPVPSSAARAVELVERAAAPRNVAPSDSAKLSVDGGEQLRRAGYARDRRADPRDLQDRRDAAVVRRPPPAVLAEGAAREPPAH